MMYYLAMYLHVRYIFERCYYCISHYLPTSRYINDCISPHGWNVEFVKLPQDWMALVVAMRDICPGEELFVSYG